MNLLKSWNLSHLLWNQNVKLNICNHHNKFNKIQKTSTLKNSRRPCKYQQNKISEKKNGKRKFNNGVLKVYWELT
jgi:hypothetical protein